MLTLYRRILVAAALLVTVFGLFRAHAEAPKGAAAVPASVAPPPVRSGDRPVRIASKEDAEKVQDPRALVRAGDHWRGAGNVELARELYARAVDVGELELYFRGGKELKEARVLELLGDMDGAAKLYRASAEKDPLYTVLALRMASRHPDRDALVGEVVAQVKVLAERAKAGDATARIYVTKKGEPRYLEKIEGKDVAKRLAAAENGELSYCYVDHLDLSDAELPPRVSFNRCVIGSVRIADKDVDQLVIKGFVLGDFDVGKTWDGEVGKSKAHPGSRFRDVTTRETVFLGRANFQDVEISGRKASFPMSVFEGEADFRGARIAAAADFRFSVFGEGANFKRARLDKGVYFGHARFRKDTTFTELYSERDVYFDSAVFEGPVRFDACEWQRRATFENARFEGPVDFTSTRVKTRLNMSRAVFAGPLAMKEVAFGGMDLIGAELLADASFVDARFDGKVRFSLDDVTRARYLDDPSPLLSLYRDYQGDEDQEEPLATSSSYGVEHVDDLIARVDGNLSFANSVFDGFVIFERVSFGVPGKVTTAEFYNTQFGGETHFERTTWHSAADFTTIYAEELALNEATFHRTLVLDDANVPGRVTLTDAEFTGDATLSFYGAEIGTFQVDRDQVADDAGDHRLWYEDCATGEASLDDLRVLRQFRGGPVDEAAFREACHDRAIDEFVSLKQSFGDRAMTQDEDWAYWWIKHHETGMYATYGGLSGLVAWPFRFLLFELAFGWGVRLGNLAFTALFVCGVFTVLYKKLCPDTVMQYNGDDTPIRDIPWLGMFYVSLQALGAFNTGWDFGESDWRFKYLNTAHTFIGVIILTFFVGAYTRMILA
ncbi:MAG: pentapeptide repeat-containing protein [Myxococcota bacterium]